MASDISECKEGGGREVGRERKLKRQDRIGNIPVSLGGLVELLEVDGLREPYPEITVSSYPCNVMKMSCPQCKCKCRNCDLPVSLMGLGRGCGGFDMHAERALEVIADIVT
jgi:hypothetical protein